MMLESLRLSPAGTLVPARFSPSAPSMSSDSHRFSASTKSMTSTLTNASHAEGISSKLSHRLSGYHGKTFKVRVVFLDDSNHIFELEKKAKGNVLLETVFAHLEVTEKDYFGLTFTEGGVSPFKFPEMMRWLDSSKLIKKQTKNCSISKGTPITFYFRVKFYTSDPSQLKEEYTRYHVYLQIRKDIMEERLKAPPSILCLLTSYVVQSTLGDFDPLSCGPGYLRRFDDLKKLCLATPDMVSSTYSLNNYADTPEEVDERISELHKLHKGQSPADAEYNFLEHAKRLEMFGIFLHTGKDSSSRNIQLGVTNVGLVVFQNYKKINTFSWSKIVKISFKRKQFFIQLRKETSDQYDTLLGFNLSSYRSCKNLWKSSVDHHSFFRLHSASIPSANNSTFFIGPSSITNGETNNNNAPKRFLMTLGSKFRYSRRAGSETENRSPFGRSPSKKFMRRTLPLGLESGSRGPRLASPETSSIGSSIHSNNGGLKPIAKSSPLKPESSSLAVRAIESFNNRVQSLSSKLPKKAWGEDIMSDDDGGFLNSHQSEKKKTSLSLSRLSKSSRTSSNVTSASNLKKTMSPFSSCQGLRLAYADDLNYIPTNSTATIDNSSNTLSFNSNSTITNSVVGGETKVPSKSIIIESDVLDSSLVIISIIPDEFGRFGFNVKGGFDQKHPVIVSRVGANTPADRCYPKLNEGDQVVMINGRDVSEHTHEQVVNYIRACSEAQSKQLVLAVKQNAYIGEDIDEPEFQYVPEVPLSCPPPLPGTQALSQSMLLLEESLDSGAIHGQFDQLHRRNPSLCMIECSRIENSVKNRYRDILPYDETRVVMGGCPSGDYINANHVVMTIPGSGIINRYIATQGPLGSTLSEFWYMVWDSQSPLIIMLTTIVERGRVKCHKYWPNPGDTLKMEDVGLEVTCSKEKLGDHFSFRDFTLIDSKGEERTITQMAYSSWPDHGVPDSSDEFVNFVEMVRTHRSASIAPTVVHCSAGIGRTGVLILMETAINLIEANQPVYPMDLTRTMRDQRASMIQTHNQYKFVCQAILEAYKGGRVKPLPEFCLT